MMRAHPFEVVMVGARVVAVLACVSVVCACGHASSETPSLHVVVPRDDPWQMGIAARCSESGPARDSSFACEDELLFGSDGAFTCTDRSGSISGNAATSLAFALLRIIARATADDYVPTENDPVILRLIDQDVERYVWLDDRGIEDAMALLAPFREVCGFGDGRAHRTPDVDATERSDDGGSDADQQGDFASACPSWEATDRALAPSPAVLRVLASSDAAALRAIDASAGTLLPELSMLASALHAHSARAGDLVVAHYRRKLARHPWARAHPTLVTRDGHLTPAALEEAVERVVEEGDATLVPLLADALAREDLRESALVALRDGGSDFARPLVPRIVPFLADEQLGALASSTLGNAALDPAAVYLDAIRRDAISPNGLGWMWTGYESSSDPSRRALFAFIVSTMIDDHREIAEIDGLSNRTRTVADVALDLVRIELELELVRGRDEAELREMAAAIRRWWQTCDP